MARLQTVRSEIRIPIWAGDFFSSPKPPHLLWGPPSHWVPAFLFGGKAVGALRLPSNAEVKEE